MKNNHAIAVNLGANSMLFLPPPHLLNLPISPLIILHKIPTIASPSPSLILCFPLPFSSMGRPPCCNKSNVKRGLWTPEEDAKILAHVANYGTGNWTLVPKKAGLNRCGKSCRLRWTNYLRPDLKHDTFTPQEEEIIINLHKAIGSRWSLIAKSLPGRTDNDVKNYWNTKLKKKLLKMEIDPVTHKPISQILSDYGKISSGLSRNTVNHLCKNIKNNLLSKPEETFSVQKNSSITYNPVRDFMPHFFSTEITSSCSSSSYSAQISPSSPFTCTEFLACESTLAVDLQQQFQHEPKVMLSSTNSNLIETSNFISRNDQGFGAYNYQDNNGSQVNKFVDAASSSASSFVDAILSKDSEISSQLFELLDGTFDHCIVP